MNRTHESEIEGVDGVDDGFWKEMQARECTHNSREELGEIAAFNTA